MEEHALFHAHTWNPLAYFGIENHFFDLDLEVLTNTWIALVIILVLAIIGRVALQDPWSTPGYLVIKGIRSLYNLLQQSLGSVKPFYFFFISALFIFIFTCNALPLFPFLEEPTKDPNTTFAFAIIAILFAQVEGLKTHGIIAFVQEYFKMPLTLFNREKPLIWQMPFALIKGIINIIVGTLGLPLELMSKGANLISLALRLFGNIFGGAIIVSLLKQAASGSFLIQSLLVATGLNLVVMFFFGLFEAFIQAFVFTILATTYLSLATQKHEQHT